MSGFVMVVASLAVLAPGSVDGDLSRASGVRMEGFVREGGEAVAGAVLAARRGGEQDESVVTVSDDRGRYVIDDLSAGRWEVHVLPPLLPGQDPGMFGVVVPGASDVAFSRRIDVEVPDVEVHSCDLDVPRTVVAGRIVSDGEAVSGLGVVFERLEGDARWSTIFELISDREGRFRAVGLPPARRIRVSAGGPSVSDDRLNRRRVRVEVALESGTVADAVRLDVSSPGAILEGRIVDEDGRPPAVARVHVFSDDGGEQTPLSGIAVREDGSYRVVGLDPGPHRLVVALRREGAAQTSERGSFVAEDVMLEVAGTTERHDRLEPDRELTVEVTWTEQGPKDPPPCVRLEGSGGLDLGRFLRVDSLGVSGHAGARTSVRYPRERVRVRSFPVQPGSYVVVAFVEGVEARRPVVLGDEDRLVEIDLRHR